MVRCVVKDCRNNYDKVRKMGLKISFYTFPKNKEICKKWMQICEGKNINLKTSRICSVHFDDNSFQNSFLKVDAIPTRFLPVAYTKQIEGTLKTFTSSSSQTEDRILDKSTVEEIKRLQQKCVELEDIQKKHQQLLLSLGEFMTPGQIKKLESGNKRKRWTKEDISSAMRHYAAGPRAYKYLRRNNYPFPAASVLRKWALKIQTQGPKK